MDDEYLDLVEDAVDCWVTTDEGPKLRNQEIRRFDIIVDELVDGFPKSPSEMMVSRTKLKNSIRSLIRDILGCTDSRSEFNQRYGSIIGGYMSPPFSTFSVGFPLNIPYGPDELTHQEVSIVQMDKDDWISQFKTKAKGHDDFEEIINESPNSFESRFTYWKVNIEANDVHFVAEEIDQLLQVVLGELIHCLQHWTNKSYRSQDRLVPYAWSELKHPFIYIILEGGKYEATYYDEEAYARVKESAPYGDQRIERKYEQIPEFTNPNQIDQNIINSFRNFQRGATEHRNEQSFFHLWRAIENLALTEDGDSSLTVLSRATSVIDIEKMVDEFGLAADSVSFGERIKKLKNKRNNLVHDGVEVEITDGDLELLRAIHYYFTPFMIINRKWTEENIIWWLENCSKDISSLQNSIKDRRDTIDENQEKIKLLKRMVSSQSINFGV